MYKKVQHKLPVSRPIFWVRLRHFTNIAVTIREVSWLCLEQFQFDFAPVFYDL